MLALKMERVAKNNSQVFINLDKMKNITHWGRMRCINHYFQE